MYYYYFCWYMREKRRQARACRPNNARSERARELIKCYRNRRSNGGSAACPARLLSARRVSPSIHAAPTAVAYADGQMSGPYVRSRTAIQRDPRCRDGYADGHPRCTPGREITPVHHGGPSPGNSAGTTPASSPDASPGGSSTGSTAAARQPGPVFSSEELANL
jgi:hypothetical protein